MSPITILGASGFIGSALVERLKVTDVEFLAPERDERLSGRRLGDIIYCIGLTGDFRARPFETVNAHVCHLLHVLRDCDFESLLYVSSSRVYQKNGTAPAREEDPVLVSSMNRDDLYNISKTMGESISLACGKKTRVVRLSNVYGPDFASENFLATIIRDAVARPDVTVHTAPEAEKDYISVHDVVDNLIKIATSGKASIYNLASGVNVPNHVLTERISDLTGCRIAFDSEGSSVTYPQISIDRMRSEFGFRPRSVIDDMGDLIDSYKEHHRRLP